MFESIFIDIKGHLKNITYGTIYRSPNPNKEMNAKFRTSLGNCLDTISKSNKPCIIQGDFNLNLLNLTNTNVDQF